MFWAVVLAVSTLLYVLLDGFDLGIGILFGLTRNETRRRAMMSAVAPIWDGNETWLVVTGVILWGAFPPIYATLLSAFYLPLILMLAGLILRGIAFEFRNKTQRLRWIWDCELRGRLRDRCLHARPDGRRAGRGPADRRWSLCRRQCWLGSARSRCCAASAFASAMRCSALAGSWANATWTCARRPIARFLRLRSRCLSFCSWSSSMPWPKTCQSCTDGSIGLICSSFRRSAPSRP